MSHEQEYVLITGATSGIGYELAKLFAKDRYNLIIVARSEEDLIARAREFREISKSKVITIAKDLFLKESAAELYNEVSEKGIAVDILVNDAGQGMYGRFVEVELERELDIIQLNVVSLVSLTKYFLKDMVGRGKGKILNLSSMASRTPGPWQAVYHATKAFVQSFTEAIRAEVKDLGVSVTALLPGITDTDFFNKAEMTSSKAVQGENANPADVAKDGYEALMKGEDMVISGLGNKLSAAIADITPDSKLAERTYKNQEPVNSQN